MEQTRKISPWPFKKEDERAVLDWISSPRRDENRQWYLHGTFVGERGSVKSQRFSWGLLPLLKMGATYDDGRIADSVAGYYGRIVINPNTLVRKITADGIPNELLNHYLFPEYRQDVVCTFYYDKVEYFLTCVEIVRAFLSPTRVLAKSIVSAGGLETLYEGTHFENQTLHLDLSPEYPVSLARPEYLLHLSWLIHTPRIRKEWSAVQRQLIGGTDTGETPPVSLLPPIICPTGIQFRGIRVGNRCLIQSILAIEDLIAPTVEKIIYTHPKFKKPVPTEEVRKQKVNLPANTPETESVQIEADEPAKKSDSPRAVSAPGMFYRFKQTPIARKKSEKQNQVRKGPVIQVGESRVGDSEGDGAKEKIVTASDWTGSGKVEPIEFKSLLRARSDQNYGLESFIDYVQQLSFMNPQISIQMSVFYLPEGCPTSTTPDGHRRLCAIVRIEGVDDHPRFIVEVGRPDRYQISTLVVRMKSADGSIDTHLLELISAMMENYGHWDENKIQQMPNSMDVYLVKHHRNAKQHIFG